MRLGFRLSLLAAALLCCGVLLATARAFWPFTVDDTFISMRYAKHLAEGLGPAWNPGGPKVEGYTTALWMALLAVPHLFGLDALLFAKAGGLVLMLGSLLLGALLARELALEASPPARAVAALFPFALGAAYWPLALHAISGMETALAALLLVAFHLTSARQLRLGGKRAYTLGALALLCTLARPEAGFACGAALLVQLVLQPRGARMRFVLAIAATCIVPGAAYFAARYAYFGLPFPLPFYVKATGHERFAGWDEVVQFVGAFVWPRPYLFALLVFGVWGARRALAVVAGLVAFLAFFTIPAHIMGFESRYLAPIVPTMAGLMGAGLGKLVDPLVARVARRVPALPASVTMLALVALELALLLWRFPAHERDARKRWVDYGQGLVRAHVGLAKDLKARRARSPHATIALLDVGAVAYYSEWFTIDTYGLNDVRAALSRRTDVAQIFAQRPDLVVVVSAQAHVYEVVFDWEKPIYERALAEGYALEQSYMFLPDYHLLVLGKSSALGPR
jgi:arabinofuranosyltransferase